jgi:Chaperone of endosialidase
MKTRVPPVLITFALACFALVQNAQAVSPPPDGGYPGGNTAEGTDALFSLTSGAWNTALGAQALKDNTTGGGNTAAGFQALLNNTTGNHNTAYGAQALFSNGSNRPSGSANTATGYRALYLNADGKKNTATGDGALLSNTSGISNTATGESALFHNTTGSDNTADGAGALLQNTTGTDNTALGLDALFNNTTGNTNMAIGNAALNSNTTGSDNIGIGINSGFAVTTANNVICIGGRVAGANVSNSCYIGSIFGQTSSAGTAVFINSDGKLGTTTSSRRFKEGIKPMNKTSESLFSLKPVSFRYKKEIDPASTSQFGLVAEDVEKVNPDLVARDKDGKPYSVRYDQVNAMLLNEFLKEHKKVEELKSEFQATVAKQQKEIKTLTTRLEEQAAQIQKVSAQLEASKPAPQVVSNP